VKDAELDTLLRRAAQVRTTLPRALARRIEDSIRPSLRPVRPLAPAWLRTLVLLLIGMGVSLSGAAWAGLQGVRALPGGARLLIFATLLLLGWVAAAESARGWIPGSRKRLTSGAVLALVTSALLGVFALLFHDFRVEHFVASGLACLGMGVGYAIPAGVLGWLVLRRGHAVNLAAAGFLVGVLAGIAGVTLLELHCTNVEALHVLVWHVLVVPACAAAGALLGWLAQLFGSRASGADRATAAR
jgi:Negative regulator of sigma F